MVVLPDNGLRVGIHPLQYRLEYLPDIICHNFVALRSRMDVVWLV